jgi:hypothetical protein
VERAAQTARWRAVVLVGSAVGLLTGCAAGQQPEVEDVATTFEDPSEDPQVRCDLLAPSTLVVLEEEASTPCDEAIEQLPLDGGAVTGVEIWGGDAQVQMDGDTVFLTETSVGWRVVAAACTPRPNRPYDCEVEGP